MEASMRTMPEVKAKEHNSVEGKAEEEGEQGVGVGD